MNFITCCNLKIKGLGQGRVDRVCVWGGGGCNTSPFFLKFVGILTKCVGKTSWPNVAGKFGVFYHKKWNAESYQYPVQQKSNFYWQWRLLKKLYKICTDDYDNNEFLAVKYIRFFTNDIVWCLQCNVYQWAEKITWKWSYNTDVKSLVKQD